MKNKLYWMTEYKLQTYDKSEATYGSYVIAESEFIATALLFLRGLNEEITSIACKVVQRRRVPKMAKLYKQRKLGTCLHTLCFTGNVLVNAKLMAHPDFLLDSGVIHDIIHEIDFPDEFGFRKHIFSKLAEIDKLSEYLGY